MSLNHFPLNYIALTRPNILSFLNAQSFYYKAHCCVSSYQSNSRSCASTSRVGVPSLFCYIVRTSVPDEVALCRVIGMRKVASMPTNPSRDPTLKIPVWPLQMTVTPRIENGKKDIQHCSEFNNKSANLPIWHVTWMDYSLEEPSSGVILRPLSMKLKTI